MPSLPALDVKTNTNHSPHVVILGAGASLATLPNGDRYGRKLPLMNNLVEMVSLDAVIARRGLEDGGENFEAWYDALASNGQYGDLIKDIEQVVEAYFHYMQLPDEVTIYDYLILSLRNKDIIASFNWDPLLSQAFVRNKDIVGYGNMPKLVFLHGNVSVGVCRKCRIKGWRYNTCSKCDKPFSPSNLLYPISKKIIQMIHLYLASGKSCSGIFNTLISLQYLAIVPLSPMQKQKS